MVPSQVDLVLCVLLISGALHACDALFYTQLRRYPGYMNFAPVEVPDVPSIENDFLHEVDLNPPSLRKRSRSNLLVDKRATVDQLLQRLIDIFGDDDIPYAGRSSHVRFGAGGKRRR